MTTDVMFRQLRYTAKKHENDKLNTFDTNITQLCLDVSNRLEELNGITEKILQLNENTESLIDVAHATYMGCTDETEKVRLDGQIRAYWQVKHMVEDILKM